MSSCCRRNGHLGSMQVPGGVYAGSAPYLVCKAMNGDAGAEATLRSIGLDWRTMTNEQKACKQKNMMKYGAAAAGIGALAYYFTAGKKK